MINEDAHIARAAAALDDPGVMREETAPQPDETLTWSVIAALRKEIADSCPSEFDDEGQKGWVRGLRRALALAEAIAVASQTAPVNREIDRLTAALAEAERRGAERMRERAAVEVEVSWGHIATPELRNAIRALPLREVGDNT